MVSFSKPVPALATILTGAGLLILPFAAAAGPSQGMKASGRAGPPATQRVEIAQSYALPPADVGGGDGGGDGGGSNDAALVVRIGRLEDQVRQLNGQIEQLQFANRQLQEQLRKFQQDVEFRFREGGGRRGKPSIRGDAGDVVVAPPAVAADAGGGTPRGDAFDPSRDPNAPGAPRPLGALPSGDPAKPVIATGAPGAGGGSSDDTPINLLSSPPAQAVPAATNAPGSVPARRPSVPATQAALAAPDGTIIADKQANQPKEGYEIALAYLKQKDYEDAERGFAAYVAKNPKGRHITDAIYYLGETYFLRGRQREAAEQYLKISAHYANSPRAPEAMLRLGESLRALNAKEQACATFSELPRKYPNASAAIKASAERAAKRAQC